MNKLRLSLFVLLISIASSFAHGAVPNDTKQAAVPSDTKQAAVPNDTKQAAVPNDTKQTAVTNDTKQTAVTNDTKQTAVTSKTKQATDSKNKINGLYFTAGIGASKLYQARETSAIELDTMDDAINTSTKTSFNLLAGYQFNRIFALEFVLTHFGNLNFDDELRATSLPSKYSPFGFSTQVNLGYTFKNGWRPFALIGISIINLNPGEPLLAGTNDQNKTPATLLTGIGIEYQPAALSGVIFRLSGTRDWYTADYNYPNIDAGAKMYTDLVMIQNISIGAGYKF